MRVYRRPRARLTPRLVVALLALVCAPRAPSALDIDWVGVGDRGNPADTAVMVTDGTSGYGQVAYSYDISRIEVTNTQYAELLNGVASCSDPHELFNPEMESDEINGGIEVVGPTICSVGDPGNPPDVNNLGSVADTYQIRPYETTNAEYAELLNAVAGIEDTNELYNPEMETSADGGILRTGEPETYVYTVKEGFEDKPVNFVSFWDAARFVNWLANGKPPQEGETRRPFHTQTAVTTENGSYNLTNEAAVANNTLTRKAGAEVFVPSRDEFYKAAYYDTASQAYYLYPAGSSDEIACTEPGDTPNTANCAGGPGTVADTGAYVGAPSPNGTFDQGGNVDEWTDTIQNFFF
ncbi:MAG: SUMF1/EgtB/PvdO family nonheme iron enzyme, partial [Myxococcota bacterium]